MAIIALRLIQFCGGAVLFGSAAFLLCSPLLKGRAPPRWCGRLLGLAALALVVAAPFGFILQTTDLAGSLAQAMQASAWHAALFQMNFGRSALVRLGCALAALVSVCAMPNGRALWWCCALMGATICASLAWMGHGAATEGAIGWVHAAADIFHILAAAGWIGALVVFCLALNSATPDAQGLHAALAAFSGFGTGLVVTILLTGIVNSAFLVGWDIEHAMVTLYGRVLAVKLVLFLLMMAFAAINRFRLTPSLRADQPAGRSLDQLRHSILCETACGLIVLALVSWLGTLPPVLA